MERDIVARFAPLRELRVAVAAQRRAHRVRADHGQPARGPRQPGAQARSAPSASSSASSSIRCSSARTRISPRIRARPKRTPSCSSNDVPICCSSPKSRTCIRTARNDSALSRAGALEAFCAARFVPGISGRRDGRHEAAQPGAAGRRVVRREGLPAADDHSSRWSTDLCMPIEDRRRADDARSRWAAMSSRNRYLQPEERAVAPRFMRRWKRARRRGRGRCDAISSASSKAGCRGAGRGGFRPDYFSIREAHDAAAVQDRRFADQDSDCGADRQRAPDRQRQSAKADSRRRFRALRRAPYMACCA